MEIRRELSQHDPSSPRTALTIGAYDGVHTGHRAVIDRARVEAADGAQVVRRSKSAKITLGESRNSAISSIRAVAPAGFMASRSGRPCCC